MSNQPSTVAVRIRTTYRLLRLVTTLGTRTEQSDRKGGGTVYDRGMELSRYRGFTESDSIAIVGTKCSSLRHANCPLPNVVSVETYNLLLKSVDGETCKKFEQGGT